MPDISMCMKKECPKRETCYRATAIPDRWQSFSKFQDCDEESNYRYYMEIDKKEIKKL